MNRLGSSVLMGVPLLTVDEVLAALDAVTLDDVVELARAVAARAALGGRRGRGRGGVPLGARGGQPRARRGGVINVAVSGAAGRMGETVCPPSRAQTTWRWSAAPTRSSRPPWRTCSATPTWSSTSRLPDSALANARACLEAGVHCVMGTTGADFSSLEGVGSANLFVAPNFAIGAVLMMKFAVEAAAPHARVRDRRASPRRQARRALGHRQAHGRR